MKKIFYAIMWFLSASVAMWFCYKNSTNLMIMWFYLALMWQINFITKDKE